MPKGYVPEGMSRLEVEAVTGAFGDYLREPHTPKERLYIVAQNMAICRKAAGMSQKDVCNVIGCAPQTYSGYEKGKHEPTIETLVRLSHLYDVTLDYLLGKNSREGSFDYEEIENVNENPRFWELMSRIERLEQKLDQQ